MSLSLFASCDILVLLKKKKIILEPNLVLLISQLKQTSVPLPVTKTVIKFGNNCRGKARGQDQELGEILQSNCETKYCLAIFLPDGHTFENAYWDPIRKCYRVFLYSHWSNILIWHLSQFCRLHFDCFRLMQFWVQTILITVLICCKPHSLQIILKSFNIVFIGSKYS